MASRRSSKGQARSRMGSGPRTAQRGVSRSINQSIGYTPRKKDTTMHDLFNRSTLSCFRQSLNSSPDKNPLSLTGSFFKEKPATLERIK
mmetsp:Transcript_40670/g.62023  ORF Transcript_40670/g.62023 Transcript_40670/m.62023 type:complete len:89 (-) Transcript_40670:1320-1586(-)